MSRNDVRRLENLPPIDGGDIYTVQLNLTPLDQLGKESGSNGEKVRAALEGWLFPERQTQPYTSTDAQASQTSETQD